MAQDINLELNIGGYGAVISPKTSLGLLIANIDIPADSCSCELCNEIYG
jgi:hypothetical protein